MGKETRRRLLRMALAALALAAAAALFLALTRRLYRRYHSLNLDRILMLAREGQEKD